MKKLALTISTLALLTGCASQSQMMINSARQTVRCTASGSGIDGLIISNSTMNNCVSDYGKLGYIPIEDSGVTGIWMSKPDGALVITKVAPNSPASKAGVVAGEEVVSVNGEKPLNSWEAVKLLFGKTGDTVTVVVKGANGAQRSVNLVLASYVSLYGAQPTK